jgi:hypothetical protein
MARGRLSAARRKETPYEGDQICAIRKSLEFAKRVLNMFIGRVIVMPLIMQRQSCVGRFGDCLCCHLQRVYVIGDAALAYSYKVFQKLVAFCQGLLHLKFIAENSFKGVPNALYMPHLTDHTDSVSPAYFLYIYWRTKCGKTAATYL